jgi:hypothetical protein
MLKKDSRILTLKGILFLFVISLISALIVLFLSVPRESRNAFLRLTFFRDKFIPAGDGGLYARVVKDGFYVYKDEKWQKIFVKGVNIGAALPGRWLYLASIK